MISRVAVLAMLLLLISNGRASAQTKDAGLWLSVNLEKKLSPAWAVQFSEELRLNENITEAGTIFSDLGISYKLNGNLRASANYRFTNSRRLDNSYDIRHRYYFDLSYRQKLKPIVFNLRGRWQSQYVDVFSSPDGKTPDKYFRPKLEAKLDLDKKITPFLSAEAFVVTGNNKDMPAFDCMRYTAGLQYAFSSRRGIEIFYLLQRERNVNNPETDYISGISYSFRF